MPAIQRYGISFVIVHIICFLRIDTLIIMITIYSKPDLLYIVIQNTMDRNSKRPSLVYINS